MQKIGVVSQKGGVGKSTLARDIARQFAHEGWRVKIADLDLKQTTSVDWNVARQAAGVEPSISVESFPTPAKALSVAGFDLLVFDGKPHSDVETKRIAEVCDLVVIPTGATRDDLMPQVKLALELREAGINPSRMIFVVNSVIELAGGEVGDAKDFIRQSGFEVAEQALPRKRMYQNAQNTGRSLSEVTHPGLAKCAVNVVDELAAKLLKKDAAA